MATTDLPAGRTQPGTRGGGAGRRALDAIDERLGLKALQYPVPEHANTLAWSLGGLTAASLLLLIVTGLLLTQFYNPVPEVANQSVRDIMTGVWGGTFIRGIHYWAAQAMYVLAGLHLLRVFVDGSYKRPREGNWLVGVALFALTVGALFTGTILKWDQEAFEALGHNLEIGRALGGLTLARVGKSARARVFLVLGELRQHDADAARLRLLRLRLGSGSLGNARCRLGLFHGLRRVRADRAALLLLDQNGLRAPMAEALPHMAGLHRPAHVERHLAPSASGLAFSLVGLTHSLSVSDPFWLANAALPLR